MEKGTKVPTRMGTFHLGDVIKVKLYERTERGGTKLTEYVGELVYYQQESRFLIKDPIIGLSYNLDMATKPIVVKKWDAPE